MKITAATPYLSARKDAGHFRQWLALRYGPVFAEGGSGTSWAIGRRLASELGKRIGMTREQVISQAAKDFADNN